MRSWRWSYILDTANTEILRTNRKIHREATAVLYRDIMPVSIDWNTNDREYLAQFMMPRSIAFNFAQSDAVLPACVFRVQQEYHGEDSSAHRISTILAAADFPLVCSRLPTEYFERMNKVYEKRTSYSLISLPRTGYSVDKIRELVWLPLKALGEDRLRLNGKIIHSNRKITDRTGVFEKTTSMLDWDQESDDGDRSNRKDESDDGDSDKLCSDKDSGDEEDSIDGNSDEENSDEGNSDQDSDEDGNNSKGNANENHEEENSDEATSNKQSSSDPGETTSQRTASHSGQDGDSNA